MFSSGIINFGQNVNWIVHRGYYTYWYKYEMYMYRGYILGSTVPQL